MINLYRVINPKNGRTPSQNFLVQLNIIHEAINDDKSKNIIINAQTNEYLKLQNVHPTCFEACPPLKQRKNIEKLA